MEILAAVQVLVSIGALVCAETCTLVGADLNDNALTFRTEASFAEADGVVSIFTEDILVNVRTHDTRALVFYAYDFHNNFVQLRLDEGQRVVFTFNSLGTICEVAVVVPGIVFSLVFLTSMFIANRHTVPILFIWTPTFTLWKFWKKVSIHGPSSSVSIKMWK